MRFLLMLVVAAGMVGCGDDDPAAPTRQPGTVLLETQHTVGGTPLVLRELRYRNAAGQTYSVELLQYFLSDVVLHRSDGVTYGLDRALYNDVDVPATLQHTLADVPPGTYESITFTWGLDAQRNVPAGLPDNPQNNNMVWPEPLGGGYHYSKCNGFYLNTQAEQVGYATHTGRLQRTGIDTEPRHHFFVVNLAISLNVDGNTATVPIVMDINQWYEAPNVYAFPDVPMIMNDPDRQQTLMENGASVFSIGAISSQ